ncbi:MAG TPA: PfkB family carbohydrate kinase [Myxococcota bacterium]|jgi:sugar/nucleoside kinase (ribokinase family)|nr:PfkB family carbohydrate kinase [Myxococcota bacterium]
MTDARDEAPLWIGARRDAEIDVIGVGQSSLDHVCLVDGLPEFAGKARIAQYLRMPGGQVATALLGCARLGLRCAFVGAVGDDEAGRAALAPLERAGIDLADVRTVPGIPTQLAVILVDRESGERTVLWHRHPALAIEPAHLSRASIARARLLHLDAGDPEAGAWAAKVAREAGIPVLLDADTAVPGMSELLAHVDFPVVSRGFAESFAGSRDPADALRGLVAGGARLAVVTLGEQGALGLLGERWLPSPAFQIVARDTTGAGDAFHAAFAWAVLAGFGPARTLRYANAFAARNCLALGAQGGLATQAELEAFLAENRPAPWKGPALP